MLMINQHIEYFKQILYIHLCIHILDTDNATVKHGYSGGLYVTICILKIF